MVDDFRTALQVERPAAPARALEAECPNQHEVTGTIAGSSADVNHVNQEIRELSFTIGLRAVAASWSITCLRPTEETGKRQRCRPITQGRANRKRKGHDSHRFNG